MFDGLLPLIIAVIIQYLIYKLLVPALSQFYKVVLIVLATLLFYVGFIGAMAAAIVAGSRSNAGEYLIYGIIVGTLFSIPPYFIASLFGRIETLEKKILNSNSGEIKASELNS